MSHHAALYSKPLFSHYLQKNNYTLLLNFFYDGAHTYVLIYSLRPTLLVTKKMSTMTKKKIDKGF